MLAVCEGDVTLPDFDWDVWWCNAVLMGVQTGDRFGGKLVKAAGLAAAGDSELWRTCVVGALVRKALPAAWLPTVAAAAGGPATDLAHLKTFVGRHREVLKREGPGAVAQLALQEPDASTVIQQLREHRMQPLQFLHLLHQTLK